jgi:hypothetical protein
MLDFLYALCAALLGRNDVEVRRLLRHPLAHALPRRVREEALAFSSGKPVGLRAPIHALHHYHQTLELVAEEPEHLLEGPQLELPLAPPPAAPISITIARAGRRPTRGAARRSAI